LWGNVLQNKAGTNPGLIFCPGWERAVAQSEEQRDARAGSLDPLIERPAFFQAPNAEDTVPGSNKPA
jgi:hypothetical protein